MKHASSRAPDLLHGPVFSNMTRFFLPIMLGSLLQQLYSMVDAVVLGRLVGKTALAAVGGSDLAIINLVVGFFVGLASGACVVVSQHYGAGEDGAVRRAVHTAILFSVVIGAVMTALGIGLARPILVLLDPPADTLEDSIVYLQWYFAGMILAIQALFFADGGLLALGANVWNMAFYGCFVGYFLIYRPLMQGRLLAGKGRTKLVLASVLGCVVTLQLGALSVVVETSLSGITALPFGAFAALMQPIHLAIGLVEGGITAAVLLFVYQTRPELLQCASASGAKNRCSRRATLAILAAAALVIGGGLSLLASANPDGLEWSLFGNEEAGYSANMGLDEEAYGAESAAAEKAAAVQEKTSLLPDYNFAGSDSAAGTSVSGLVGCALVAALAAIISLAGRTARKKSGKKQASAG